MKLNVYQALHFFSVLCVAFSAHFRGGTLQWKPVMPFNGSINIAYQISWRRAIYDCDNSTIASGTYLGAGSLYCSVGCTGYVGTMLYRCTAFSEHDDWSYGRNEYQYNVTGISYFEIQFASCCWLSTLQIGMDGSWSLIMRGNLTVRKDTGNINSSPDATMPPIVKAPSGCISQIRLNARDTDGDIVRCRWASSNKSECGGVCDGLPNSALNPDTCIITYQGGNRTGEYPVAIQVEDFMKASDTIPLSSVPLQFVVNVVPPSYASIPCEYLPPVFIPPTPLNGTCIPVLRGQTWNGVLLAQVQSDLARISYISVSGVTPYVVAKNDTHISVGIAWTVNSGDSKQVICFNATDSLGTSSGTQCFTLLVMKSAGVEVNVVSDSVVKINWTHATPAELGFNVLLYTVTNNSTVFVIAKQMDGCALSTQFSGIAGGTPYIIEIIGVNGRNETVETIVSNIFFTSQKVPTVPPYGVEYIVLPGNDIMLKWFQPTLIEARGFVIGYTLVESCSRNSAIDGKVYDISTNYVYLQAENSSRATCSVLVCARTVAGCGPLSQPLVIQDTTSVHVNVVSENKVEIIWTPSKPARLGFNVSLCKVMNTSLDLMQTLQTGNNSRKIQFDGLDAGTPYQVKIIGINEFHTTEESIVSPIFFTSEKIPSVPPFGITQTLFSGNNSSMLKWLQPTLSEARGFIVGYSLTYACTINRNSTKVKLYETTQSYFYLQSEDNSALTCSISVCVRTIAGCGPLSQPVVVQGLQVTSDEICDSQTTYMYFVVISVLTAAVIVMMIVFIAFIVKRFITKIGSKSTTPEVIMYDVTQNNCNLYESIDDKK